MRPGALSIRIPVSGAASTIIIVVDEQSGSGVPYARRPLTEKSWILSDEEQHQGYINRAFKIPRRFDYRVSTPVVPDSRQIRTADGSRKENPIFGVLSAEAL